MRDTWKRLNEEKITFMTRSPLISCLWGQTKCPKQVLNHGSKHQKSQDHRLRMWQGDKWWRSTYCHLPRVPGMAWEESFLSPGLRQDNSPMKLSRVSPHKKRAEVLLSRAPSSEVLLGRVPAAAAAAFQQCPKQSFPLVLAGARVCLSFIVVLLKCGYFPKEKKTSSAIWNFPWLHFAQRWLVPPRKLSALCNIFFIRLFVSTEAGT